MADPGKRRALVISSPRVMSLQEAAELVPGPGEVVARPVHTGICDTDLDPPGVSFDLVIDDVVNNDPRISASFADTSRRRIRCCDPVQARDAG